MKSRSLRLPLQPPRDASDNVVPHDHEEILNEHGVIRRVSDQFIVDDEKSPTGRRISKMLFQASSGTNGGMSVDLQNEIEKNGYDAKVYVTTPRFFGSVRLQAGQYRNLGFRVGADPIPMNEYHGEVWGTFSKGKQNRLLGLCDWFVPIPGVSIM
jgi:hypothetical protein